jgi:hypothetical protein
VETRAVLKTGALPGYGDYPGIWHGYSAQIRGENGVNSVFTTDKKMHPQASECVITVSRESVLVRT